MVTPFKFTEEQRRAAVERVAKGGESYTAVAKDLGVSPQSIKNWQDALGAGSVASRPTRVAPPKGEGGAAREGEDEGAEERAPAAAKPRATSGAAPAKKAAPPKPKATEPEAEEVDAVEIVEELDLPFRRSLAVLAIIEGKIDEAREHLDAEISRGRTS
jgi:transposase-like protein